MMTDMGRQWKINNLYPDNYFSLAERIRLKIGILELNGYSGGKWSPPEINVI